MTDMQQWHKTVSSEVLTGHVREKYTVMVVRDWKRVPEKAGDVPCTSVCK